MDHSCNLQSGSSDQDQQLSQHVEYLPSGELWADQTDSRFQNRQPYLFNGKELDLSTGLYHYGARSYEPRLGVWLSPDPVLTEYMVGRINGGVYRPINLGMYTYAWNNPVVLMDPTGRWPTVEEIEAGLARAEDTVLGFSYGFVLGATPVVGNLLGFMPPPKDSESFQVGMGAGQMTGGVVQMAVGGAIAGGSAAGGVAATAGSGGAAAPAAVPVAIAGVEVGAVLVTSGRAAVMQGAMTMQMAANGGDSNSGKTVGQPAGGGLTRSEHATVRNAQGRPVPQAVQDLRRAGQGDVFVQDNGRFVIRGPKGREHIIDPDGTHITSLVRSNSAHQGRVRDGTIRPATMDEFEHAVRLVK